MASGIYQIENQRNGKRYIGSAVNIRHRWAQHLNDLHRGEHHNRHLQRAFNKYGEATFVFEVLEETRLENLIEREQHYFDTLNPEYNIARTAGNTLGVRYTEETLAKMSRAHTGERHHMYGKHLTKEHRRKIGLAHKGKHVSEETRAKISAAHMGERNHNYGKHPSEATRAKIGTAHRHENLSEETLAKMSMAHRHENLSEETLAKMSAAQVGKHLSVETRAKIRVANIGKHHSAETRAKMSIAQRARRRRERELKEE